MNAQILSIIGSILVCIIGAWKYMSRKNEFKRKKAEEAKNDIEKANSEGGTASDFLDGFNKL